MKKLAKAGLGGWGYAYFCRLVKMNADTRLTKVMPPIDDAAHS